MLQPKRKSFEHYIEIGYKYVSSSPIDSASEKIGALLNGVGKIDDSILVIDDFLDGSDMRNGKPCFYKIHGPQTAIVHSLLTQTQSFDRLLMLINSFGISESRQIQIVSLWNKFLQGIYLGEKENLSLSQKKKVTKNTIQQYLRMVSLFTGGHISYGLEIGQLLADKDIDLHVRKIAASLGRIRQICDDFDDYFSSHHEPFGDFISGDNRLPEIIFKIGGGSRTDALRLLQAGRIDEFRGMVLNENVRKHLFGYCEIEYRKAKRIKTCFDYSDMMEDYARILTRK